VTRAVRLLHLARALSIFCALQTGAEAALRACLPQLDHLDAPSFVAFVRYIDAFGELEVDTRYLCLTATVV
jgi:hypothetical protein